MQRHSIVHCNSDKRLRLTLPFAASSQERVGKNLPADLFIVLPLEPVRDALKIRVRRVVPPFDGVVFVEQLEDHRNHVLPASRNHFSVSLP